MDSNSSTVEIRSTFSCPKAVMARATGCSESLSVAAASAVNDSLFDESETYKSVTSGVPLVNVPVGEYVNRSRWINEIYEKRAFVT